MPAVDALCRSYLDLAWHFDPAAGSAAGATAADPRLGRFDDDAVREHVAALRALAAAAEELEADDLQDEIDRTALLGELRGADARLTRERPHARDPGFWLGHLFAALHALLARPETPAGSRVPAALERLRAVPEFLGAARATITAPPPVFVDTALGMLGGGGELVAQAVAALGARAPALAPELTTAGEAALRALAAFGRALRDEVEPSPDPGSFALGAAAFDRRLHELHALRDGAAELGRYGERLVEETGAALAAAARELGDRPWRELADALREESPEPSELLDVYRREIRRARECVGRRDLAALPEGPLEVVPTPRFLAPLLPFAAYEPPPVELPDPTGRFYVTVPDPSLPAEAVARQRRGHCAYAIPAIVAHEAWPGHHLQLLTARGLRSEVRRHLWTPLTVEGWALYAEELMAEAGYYRTPEARLFRLVNLRWRAARVVLDVGLHTRGMTPREAVDYLVDRVPIERASAEAEVRRYCANPTYQLCYAVGRRELLRLREAYRGRAGSGFTPRRFHDELLGYGGIPVPLARWGMGLGE